MTPFLSFTFLLRPCEAFWFFGCQSSDYHASKPLKTNTSSRKPLETSILQRTSTFHSLSTLQCSSIFWFIMYSFASSPKHSTLHHYYFSQTLLSSSQSIHTRQQFQSPFLFCFNRFKTFPFYSKSFLRKSIECLHLLIFSGRSPVFPPFVSTFHPSVSWLCVIFDFQSFSAFCVYFLWFSRFFDIFQVLTQFHEQQQQWQEQ